ncbi:hypothetical protein [Natrinema halophilum]|uniref:DUF7974 domain-containing protein n=1 Tax=Natrinema halophilum TaxID=1699371 RepID=A0A7D5KKQ9_9EURY|nr:hypothetical protein [Natrinema halophilum]QLG50719.1 hypothetical protein HYG82_18690 [Natrinema halophilum]
MKRIYESGALERTDDDPFTPDRRSNDEKSGRAVNWAALSHALTPTAVRRRAIDVTVSTDKRRYDLGEPVELVVSFRNRFPFPIRLRTESPNRWTWAVDGHREASQVPRAVPDRPAAFSFDRGECKRFRRTWPQRIRITDDEWKPVAAGTYTIEASITREDAAKRGLGDATEIEIRD